MAKTLQQILGGKNLTGVIQGVKGGVPADLVPPQFISPTRTVEGNHCTYRKVEGTRKLARMVQYGSPAKTRSLSGVSELPVKLIHTFESINHEPAVLMNLTQLDSEAKQKLGMNEVARQTKEFRDLFDNLRLACFYSIMRYGAIYFDGDGNLLPSSTGAVVTVDMGVPKGNKNQLAVDGATAIINASWATAATDIHKQITSLKKAARKLTGYPIAWAFHGENILDYFLKNTSLKEIIFRNAGMQSAFSSGEIPDGFLGLKWRPISEAFFVDSSDAKQDLSTGDQVTFTPEPSPDWWEVIQGTYPVPTDIGAVSADGVAALGSIEQVAGHFSYAVVSHNPVGIEQFAGDTFLIVPKVPSAMFIADVTP